MAHQARQNEPAQKLKKSNTSSSIRARLYFIIAGAMPNQQETHATCPNLVAPMQEKQPQCQKQAALAICHTKQISIAHATQKRDDCLQLLWLAKEADDTWHRGQGVMLCLKFTPPACRLACDASSSRRLHHCRSVVWHAMQAAHAACITARSSCHLHATSSRRLCMQAAHAACITASMAN